MCNTVTHQCNYEKFAMELILQASLAGRFTSNQRQSCSISPAWNKVNSPVFISLHLYSPPHLSPLPRLPRLLTFTPPLSSRCWRLHFSTFFSPTLLAPHLPPPIAALPYNFSHPILKSISLTPRRTPPPRDVHTNAWTHLSCSVRPSFIRGGEEATQSHQM